MDELTRNGSQNIGDEHVHQSLVEKVVTVLGPAQDGLKLAQHHQAGLGQTLLRLVVSAEMDATTMMMVAGYGSTCSVLLKSNC